MTFGLGDDKGYCRNHVSILRVGPALVQILISNDFLFRPVMMVKGRNTYPPAEN